ncbi:hypothetical protein L2E82_42606 [Cichorium intybus]|uniref:Uncharacterized protein n=1 Tax=Cichorium intybus TaxID=13427 RepID=A0ACB8ZMH0_CICIN|nr:hypothetical protein L2E82_42606 [Cichorium intybus]
METRSAKRRKLRSPEHSSGSNTGEDRISDLPDAVLHHIFCLLPIKSIVHISILSKRWRALWYTFPDLDFTTIIPPGTAITKFVYLKKLGNVITQILALREKLSDVRTLRFYACMSFSGLHALIRSAIRLQVQELDIRVATNDTFNFPRSIITSDCLRVLKVTSYSGFRLPPSRIMRSGFQKLRTLSLSFVYLDNQSSIVDLFTDCSFPQLTKLYLDSCFNLKHLRVGCHLLEELILENCSSLQGLEIASPRLDTLRVSSCFDASSINNTWFQIDAPRLNTIVWANSSITTNSCIKNIVCLHEVTIGFLVRQENLDADKLQNVSGFLSGLSHTESLTLESGFVEIMLKNKPLATIFFHPFMKLKSLELHISEVLGLACLLKICPMIHTLIINITEGYKAERRWNRHSRNLSNSWEEKFWESHTKDLKPLLCYLKIVKIQGFSESENDISLVKFLLKHAKVLQDLILCLRDDHSRGYHRHEKFKSQIMGFSRASLDAKLEFS